MNDSAPESSDDPSVAMQRYHSISLELSERKSSNSYEALGLGLVLYGLQSPVNIGMILRLAETFQFNVSIFDPSGILIDPDKFRTMKDFACGAMSRRGFYCFDERSALAKLRSGRRLIATSISRNAQPLKNFHFLPRDLIALGNEYDGLPDDVVASADVLLRVPTPAVWMPKERSHSPIDPLRSVPVARDGQPSLNVAVAAGILCYSAYGEWLANT